MKPSISWPSRQPASARFRNIVSLRSRSRSRALDSSKTYRHTATSTGPRGCPIYATRATESHEDGVAKYGFFGDPAAVAFSPLFRFEDCELDVARFELRRHGEVVHVEPQVFDLLVHLVEHRDRVVTKTELLDSVWGDRFVSESALTTRVKAARRAVGDDGAGQRIIRTVHRRGYQFVAGVDVVGEDAAPSTAPMSHPATSQDIRFCVSGDGVR